jgi:hypothetical protein
VHVIDNWSTDDTYERAQSLVAQGVCSKVVRFPDLPSAEYQWESQLAHTADYAASLEADWVMHCDADELRFSPWPNISLSNAIGFVDALGYSAIDFTVLNFLFTEEEPAEAFSSNRLNNWFEWAHHIANFQQVKCWRNVGPIDLHSTGGHEVQFQDRRIYPLKFLTKHYPLRSLEQANRKIYRDRFPRINREWREKNWHVHYDHFRLVQKIMPWRRFELINFDENIFNMEYLVERISGIGVESERGGSINIRTQNEELHPRIAKMQMELAKQAAKLRELSEGASQREAELRSEVASRDQVIAACEQTIKNLLSSTSWRITAPLRTAVTIFREGRSRQR